MFLDNLIRLNSIRKKFTILLVLSLIVIFVIFAFVLVRNNISVTQQNLVREARAISDLSTKKIVETYNLYYNSGYYKFIEIEKNILDLSPSIKRMQIIDMNGGVVFDSFEIKGLKKESAIPKEILDAVTKSEKTEIKSSENPKLVDQIIYPYFDDWGAHRFSVRYFISYDEVGQNAAKLGNIIIWLALVFILSAILIFYSVIDRLILKPVEKLEKETKIISSGNYNHQIILNSKDEMGNLAESVNFMATTLASDIIKLKEADKLKDEFIDIAAHNFGTPVTHIRIDLDFLKSELKGKADAKSFNVLKDIESSNEDLALLIGDLLSITTLESGKIKLVKFAPCDLRQIIDETIELYSTEAEKKKIKLIWRSTLPKAEVLGDKYKIKQVFSNLLDNALKFTEKGEIKIDLRYDGNYFIVTLEDTGIGIKAEEMPKLFNKFHRATDVKTYNYEGEGLGLYVSKLIIEAHNGRIWAESQLGEGSKFSFSLPKNQPADDKNETNL